MNAHKSSDIRTARGQIIVEHDNKLVIMAIKIEHRRCTVYMCVIIWTFRRRCANNTCMRILAVLKKKVLLGSRTLNREPESVRCELFQKDFFDPHDRAQVKYEMLRSHSVDKRTVAEVCREFGFSRESFYRIKEVFKQLGFSSLLPAKTGRKGPTKLKGEVLKFALEKKEERPDIDPGQLADLITKRYGVHVHRTTVMRAMKKKPYSSKRSATRFR